MRILAIIWTTFVLSLSLPTTLPEALSVHAQDAMEEVISNGVSKESEKRVIRNLRKVPKPGTSCQRVNVVQLEFKFNYPCTRYFSRPIYILIRTLLI